MKWFATDLLILGAVIIAVGIILFLPGVENARVEKNWGEVHYSSPVTRREAQELAQKLIDAGLFTGTHASVGVTRDGDLWILRPVYQKNYESLLRDQGATRDDLIRSFEAFCQIVFPGKTVSVQLADDQLEPFETLIERKSFSATPSVEPKANIAP